MNQAAIFHRALDNWCYQLNAEQLHIRLQTAAADVDAVELAFGDPFDWQEKTWRYQSALMRKGACDGLHDFWELEITPPWKRCKYSFLISSQGKTWLYGEAGLVLLGKKRQGQQPHYPGESLFPNAFSFPYLCQADRFVAPGWVESTVWYQIFPERFQVGKGGPVLTVSKDWHRGPVRNDESYGGNVRGIIDGLDHIASLGCNGIYLTPVFLAQSTHNMTQRITSISIPPLAATRTSETW